MTLVCVCMLRMHNTYVCMWCVLVHTCVKACVWRPKVDTCSFPHSILLFSETESLTDLELTDLARLAGWWAPGIHLPPLPQYQDCGRWCQGSKLRSSCLHNRLFHNQAIDPALLHMFSQPSLVSSVKEDADSRLKSPNLLLIGSWKQGFRRLFRWRLAAVGNLNPTKELLSSTVLKPNEPFWTPRGQYLLSVLWKMNTDLQKVTYFTSGIKKNRIHLLNHWFH